MVVNKCDKEQERLLVEGCEIMMEDMIKINREWEMVDSNLGWEWNDD